MRFQRTENESIGLSGSRGVPWSQLSGPTPAWCSARVGRGVGARRGPGSWGRAGPGVRGRTLDQGVLRIQGELGKTGGEEKTQRIKDMTGTL